MAAHAYPFEFGLKSFTVSMWMKYEHDGGEGTFFSLFGMK